VPFDSACAFGFAPDGPDRVRIEDAAARFDLAHPYLLFRREAIRAIRRRTAADRRLRKFQQELLAAASSPPASGAPRAIIKRRARRLIGTAFAAVSAKPSIARPALAESRRVLSELAAASSWKQRPVIRSFLDCAEIAVAVALAYDWLYEKLEPDERCAIERAMRRNVLEPALADYEDHSVAWPRRRDNCTLVSNAGIAVAALVVLPTDRTLSVRVLQHSLASSSTIFSGMAPDGAWREGLSYWSLAIRYAGLMVAALESTLGDSFGLANCPGFAETGDFALHSVGPFGATFNFGDSESDYDASPLPWFANRFGRPVDAWLARDGGSWAALLRTIWPCREQAPPTTLGLPTGKIFYSADLACFRSSWKSRPVYLAIKGGNAATRPGRARHPTDDFLLHAQADAGTFVIDGAKHRWAVDLGPDDYDLPGYFDHGEDGRPGQRWTYYRARAAGHNTLLIGGRDQTPDAPAPIVDGAVDRDCKWVVLDLSAAYGKPSGTVRRGAALLGRQIAIQDEIDPSINEEIVWTMHTAAQEVTVSGPTARLHLGGDLFRAHIVAPAGAQFELTSPPPSREFAIGDLRNRHGDARADSAFVSETPYADPTEGQAIRRLQIVLPRGTPRVAVLLMPDCDGGEPALAVTPLADWHARRPLRLTDVARRTTSAGDSGVSTSTSTRRARPAITSTRRAAPANTNTRRAAPVKPTAKRTNHD
jgi:Heparinase II/III-like protein